MSQRRLVLFVVLLGGVGLPAPAPAEAPSSREALLEQRLEYLDQKVRVLERRFEVKEENELLRFEKTPVVGAGSDGFYLKSPKGDFELKLRGLIQADGRYFLHEPDSRNASTFLLRRVRPILSGTVFDYWDFYLMADFGGGTTVLQDAYIEYRYFPKAKVRLGKFKSPFGLERLQSASNITFIERALPTNLVPNRDNGIQISGEFDEGTFTYQASILNGVTDGGSGDSDNNDNKEVVARVFAQPFKPTGIEALQGLGIGLAVSYGNQKGATLPTYRTTGQETFFRYNSRAVAIGQRTRISPQLYYAWGPFGLMAEYVLSAQDVQLPPVAATKTTKFIPGMEDTFRNSAWQIAGSWVLTGEKASYRGVKPLKPFDLESSGWGAWEIALRYGELEVDREAFDRGFADITTSSERARAWAVGLNWYLNRNLKYVVNYERTSFDGGAKFMQDREPENILLSRLQIAF